MAERASSDGAALPRRLPRGAPKGQALRAILEELLATLPPGTALPSERELAERYGLARMTVRNEIERLTAEGSVYRLHGRGTFVAEPRIAQAGALTSFTEDMLARGHVPGSTVSSSEVVEADGFLAAALEVKPGDECFRLDRVRTADGRPLALEQVYLPLQSFAGIEQVDFADASLFAVLADGFGIELGDAEQRVVAVSVEADEAPLLEVPEGAPALRFHTVTRDREGTPVFYAISLYPGDRYEIALRQTRE
jgi:GntR family transcriptional regulator